MKKIPVYSVIFAPGQFRRRKGRPGRHKETRRQASGSTHVAPGALLMMNEMAKTGRKKPIDLMTQRETGRDRDRLAAENKYDLATALPKLERVQQAMEAQHKQIKR